MAENKHWLSQIKLGEWYSNAQYYYRPRNDKERNLMHSCYEEGYNDGFSNGLAEGRKENAELKAELKAELQHYADVINRLMGTQLTDTFEIGRLIAIAQYGNWSEL